MGQKKLTYEEILLFLIDKVNYDREFTAKFKQIRFELDCTSLAIPADSTAPIDSELLSMRNDYIKRSKQQQLELEVYPRFKSKLGLKMMQIRLEYKSLEIILYEYRSFQRLHSDVYKIDKYYEELTVEQSKKIWVYMIISECIIETVTHTLSLYKPKSTPPTREERMNAFCDGLLNLPEFDYKAAIEVYFKSVISAKPDASTIRYIDEIRKKVEKDVGLEVDKARVTGRHRDLMNLVDDKKIDIVKSVSFYKQWIEQDEPSINETKLLSQWESYDGFKLLLENLLSIQILERAFLDLSSPKNTEWFNRREKKRKEESALKKTTVRNAVNDWIGECFIGRISESEMIQVMGAIDELFKKEELCDIKPIKNVKDLKSNDLGTFIYAIWKKYDKDLSIKLNQDIVAEYIYKQFPNVFKDSDHPDTIKKHLKREGKIIKEKEI